MAKHPEIAVVQEYVPTYRLPFFDELRRVLAADGISLVVAAGRPNEAAAGRNDSDVSAIDCIVWQREFTIFGKRLNLRNLPARARRADVVVLEQARRNLDTYWYLLRPWPRGRKVLLWGHGVDYSHRPGGFSSWLIARITRMADGCLVYTEGGKRQLVAQGFPGSRVTVLNNSTDTRALRQAQTMVNADVLAEWRNLQNLGDGPCFGFIGALTESKGVALLAETWRLFSARNARSNLLVAGNGPAVHHFCDSVGVPLPGVRLLGYVDERQKALMGAVCDALIVPGQVGLVAVDALTLGLPLITVPGHHGPEIDYLSEEKHVFFADPDAASLADKMNEVHSRTSRGFRPEPSEAFGVEQMARAFARGVKQVLSHDSTT